MDLGGSLGAHPTGDGRVVFRCWTTTASTVELELDGRRLPMEAAGGGEWEALVAASQGARYRFVLDGKPFPDPYSRSQPDGVHGPSEVVADDFVWTDGDWRGLTLEGLVIWECHAGTATPGGRFDDLVPLLPYLRDLGVNALELMPVSEFPGSRNWGYDGVYLYAPSWSYGGPPGLRALVDAAHREGIGVILDVVYNHFGPDGNYLGAYSPDYFTDRYHTPWGQAINYDGENSSHVRRMVVENALHWLNAFHIDGLRLDATHAIHDASEEHILAEIKRRSLEDGPRDRSTLIIAEDDRNEAKLLRPPAAGYGLDATWADDFHHQVHVLLTGERDGYFAGFEGTAADIAQTVQHGFFYEGQPSPHHGGKRRGTQARDLRREAFVYCLQNHDQVGNRALGERLHHLTTIEDFKAASALLLLAPETPLLFMGQEFAASSPFQYFTDHEPELGKLVTEGRRKEFARFKAFADPEQRDRIPDPQAESTFLASKLRLDERTRWPHSAVLAFYRSLLRLRREDPVWRDQRAGSTRVQPLDGRLLALQRRNESGERLLLCNFAEPVEVNLHKLDLAGDWAVDLYSTDQRYGGDGALPSLEDWGAVELPASCAVVLSRS